MIAGQAAERRAYQAAQAAQADDAPDAPDRRSSPNARPRKHNGPLTYDDSGPDGPTLRGTVPIVRRSLEEAFQIAAERNRNRTS